jgi:aspartate/methionine/tyrosine aminotransferase
LSAERKEVEERISGNLREDLGAFCLERWQSLHENYAAINLSESGVFPLKLSELEDFGLRLDELKHLELGYGWTRGSPELRERISVLYNGEIGKDEVLVTAGSAEANLVTAMSVLKEGDLALVDVPNYMQVPGLLPFLGARVLELKRSSPAWKFPIDEAIRLIQENKPRVVFICNPNNPTGQVLGNAELEELGDVARKAGTILVFDEVYWGSELNGEKPSALEVIGKDVAISISGLSKVYGLPGLRIGWIAGRREVIERAWSFKDYTSIAPSMLSDKIASSVLSLDSVKKLRERARRIVGRNLELFTSKVSRDLLDAVIPEAGAFIWAKVPWFKDTLGLSLELFSRRGILVNPGECFESPGFLRIGIGQKSEDFSSSLEKLVEGLVELRKGHLL